MISLINRLSWILSFSLGFTISSSLSIMMWMARYWDEAFFFIIIAWIILTLIIKKIFLNRSFIQTRVVEFSTKLILKAWWKRISYNQNEEDSFQSQQFSTSQKQKDNIPDYEENKQDSYVIDKTIDEVQEEPYLENNIEEDEEETDSEPEIPRGPNFIEKFLAENAIAKIGWICLFIWVLFFLSYLYTSVWPVQKVIIWFVTGFTFFWIWIALDIKWYKNESRIMLWVWILVNYLVILSWRYLIWIDSKVTNSSSILTEWTTFLFLIINTILAIVTSLVYKSKNLLLFSFVFAFLNPFLIWAKSDWTPFTLVWYWAIVALGALVLSQLYFISDDKSFSKYLRYTWFIWWNILFLIAPFGNNETYWLIKLVLFTILSLTTLILAYRNDDKNNLGNTFILTYIVFWILLITWWKDILHTWTAFLGYISFIILALGMTSFMIISWSIISLSAILLTPLILLFWLLITWSLFYIVPVLLGTILIYLIIFSFLFEILTSWFKYLFFVWLCIFLTLSNVSLSYVIPNSMDNITHLSVIISSIIFMFSAYFFSRKDWLEYLYSIGTVGSIFLLVPIIATKWEFMNASIVAIIIFTLANVLTPFINRNLCENDLKNLAISIVAWIIFIWWELYNYWDIANHFPWVTLGFAFMWLAIGYFVLWFTMMNILDIQLNQDSLIKNEDKKNAIFWYLWVSISLFSIAILIIFSDKPAIVASLWFFESTILMFFYSRIKDIKIYIWTLVLFLIWIFKYSIFIGNLGTWNFYNDAYQLIPIIAIFISFILNLKFLEKTSEETRIFHDILHIIAMIMVWIWVMKIVPHSWHGFSIFAISIVLLIVWFCYNLFASKTLVYTFTLTLIFYFIYHILSLDTVFYKLERDSLTQLKYLQYLTVAIPGVGLYFLSKYKWKLSSVKNILLVWFMIYLFIITSMFVLDISRMFDDKQKSNVFSITIYWAIWAYAYISNWINRDNKKRRTIGLYILTLVIIKIFCFDIIFWINNQMLRIVALMFVGWLMIYISMLYSRKYSGNLLSEFNFSNLKSDLWDIEDNEQKSSNKPNFLINKKISDIDTGDVTMVIFELNNGKNIKIKSKNLIKIAKLVENNLWKTEFQKNELKNIYTYILNNYQSELKPDDYKKIVEAMKEFVEEGGKLIFE